VRNDKGALQPVLDNVFSIMQNDERWAGVIGLDEFAGRVTKIKASPLYGNELGEWSDDDTAELDLWLSNQYSLRVRKKDILVTAVLLCARRNKYHEVRDYINSLVWDGTVRLRHWLTMFMGADQSPYVESVAEKWMISSMARIFAAPVKVDHVLILEGKQGIYKSTALKVLAGKWFTDQSFKIGDKDGLLVIRGKQIVELAELDGFNKAENAAAKAFFPRETDRYRGFYGTHVGDVPRQCVFAGTVNHAQYLRDDTGNRRYWPVLTRTVDLKQLAENRDQLWAEAKHLYDSGASWWPSASEREMFSEEQEDRFVGDAYETQIRGWLDTPDNGGVKPHHVTMAQLMGSALRLDVSKWTAPEQQRVGRIMSRIGWPRRRVGEHRGERERVYVRPEAEEGAKT
jgi:putative DNA primase/helicase